MKIIKRTEEKPKITWDKLEVGQAYRDEGGEYVLAIRNGIEGSQGIMIVELGSGYSYTEEQCDTDTEFFPVDAVLQVNN